MILRWKQRSGRLGGNHFVNRPRGSCIKKIFRDEKWKEARIAAGCARKLRYVVMCSVLMIMVGCELKAGNPLNDPKKFAEVYTALQIAAAQDSMNVQRADIILRQHGYSRRQFEEAVAHYNSHAEEWAKVLQHSVAKLDSAVQAEARADSIATKASSREGKP